MQIIAKYCFWWWRTNWYIHVFWLKVLNVKWHVLHSRCIHLKSVFRGKGPTRPTFHWYCPNVIFNVVIDLRWCLPCTFLSITEIFDSFVNVVMVLKVLQITSKKIPCRKNVRILVHCDNRSTRTCVFAPD